MNQLITANIDKWAFVDNKRCFCLPSKEGCRLVGQILNDTKGRFKDRTYIKTSEISIFDIDSKIVVTKSGSIYELDSIDYDYSNHLITSIFKGDTYKLS